MGKSIIRRLLVIGDNPDDKAAIYSADTKVKFYPRFKYEEREKLRNNQLTALETILNSPTIKLSEVQREVYKNLYLDTKEMDAEEFYESVTYDMKIDEETGDAYTNENPNAKYRYQTCYDKRLKSTGQESDFSDPFKLKDGTKAYSARNSEIDWSKNHMANTEVYRAAWELCVDDREPKNETEETIKKNMQNRKQYFSNFKNVDEYVRHSCCFWTNDVVDNEGRYYGLNYKISDKEWISNFYDRFIKGLPENTLLTLYEVRSLND